MRLVGIIILFTIFVSGCIPPQTAEEPDTFPILIHQEPLPPFPVSFNVPEVRLEVKLYVKENGDVGDVEILTSSGNRAWDREAEACITGWKYTPAQTKGKPVGLWIRQIMVLQFRERFSMNLAEIVCRNQPTADSAYSMLETGLEFPSVAQRMSVSGTRTRGGELGSIDIRTYPLDIQDRLKKLGLGEYSRPLKLGDRFVIFRRMPRGPES